MSSDTNLRSCPFCGDDEPDIIDNGRGCYWVHCTECGANGPGCFDAEGAAVFWNDRAYDDERRRV